MTDLLIESADDNDNHLNQTVYTNGNDDGVLKNESDVPEVVNTSNEESDSKPHTLLVIYRVATLVVGYSFDIDIFGCNFVLNKIFQAFANV